jgi:ferric-dicitrate binding protein FerR (iron transport regulator)
VRDPGILCRDCGRGFHEIPAAGGLQITPPRPAWRRAAAGACSLAVLAAVLAAVWSLIWLAVTR